MPPEEWIGAVIDVTYGDPPETQVYRLRVQSYDKKLGWHTVNSKGLSLWDGEDFKDELDISLFQEEGRVKIVKPPSASGSRSPAQPKRATMRQKMPAPKSSGGHPKSSAVAAKTSPTSRKRERREATLRGGSANTAVGDCGVDDDIGFDEEIVGQVIDVTYNNLSPVQTYRVRVTSVMPDQGWHSVESTGLSQWGGQDFTDVLDISQMFTAKEVRFVGPVSEALLHRAEGMLLSSRIKSGMTEASKGVRDDHKRVRGQT
eukprot:TRINITY_DN73822_c0_g1_i1.p1 TRINITY_DN73822_c0_g1~~TRINITY_DN73822_c0_g1_i1.p1  ORF type:complete len:279 (-),score=47.05 TRINITY_DN73822_c0_g1_i1:235-1011(-)